LLQYNLACYFFLLGEKAEAQRRLKAAIMIEPSFAAEAITDPDLKGIISDSPPEV
jgi:L-asparaginase II